MFQFRAKKVDVLPEKPSGSLPEVPLGKPDDTLGWVGCASRSSKQTNQDVVEAFRGVRSAVLAVADGVGSAQDADVAASLAVESFLKTIREVDSKRAPTREDVDRAWEAARASIQSADVRSGVRTGARLQTTLVTVVDLGNRYLISYLGNGSVFFVRGDFNDFVTSGRWPWSIANLVVGHSVLDPLTGKDVLQRVLKPGLDSAAPTYVEHDKDLDVGEIILACSDGVGAAEQLAIGSADGKLWTEVNPHLRSFVEDHLSHLAGNSHLIGMTGFLDNLASRFLASRTFEDDASLAILVSPMLLHRLRSHRQANADTN